MYTIVFYQTWFYISSDEDFCRKEPMAADQIADYSELIHPVETPPPAGSVMEIASGIHWLRMPLPGRLDHVNLWILEEEDGWTLIDCGLNNPQSAEIWTSLLDGMLSDRPIKNIILTHAHVDHIGYLGHLVEQTGAPIIMTMSEYFGASLRIFEPHERMVAQSTFALNRCGCPPDIMEAMVSRRKEVRTSYSGIPPYFSRAMDGQGMTIGRRYWQFRTFGGHSPEMLCLHDVEGKVLIAGDQVLSQITPSINVYPAEPLGDPLSAFYESFPKLEALDADTFVLPSHGRPFYGLHQRVRYFREHHEERLGKILSYVEGDVTAYEVALKTFARAMETHVARQALAETLAHLHFLEKRGRINSRMDDAGRVYFSRTK